MTKNPKLQSSISLWKYSASKGNASAQAAILDFFITVPTILQYSGPVLISLPLFIYLFIYFFSVDGTLARAL